MSPARAACWRSLSVGVLLATRAGVVSSSTPAAPDPPPAHACGSASCGLARPTAAEFDAILAEADRLLGQYADDRTPLGQQCHTLGAAMRARAADVRMLPYMWRTADPEGNMGPVTGDAHPVEVVPGTGRVHVARGYDTLNPDRGLAAILQTARHEFAHLVAHQTGARQHEGWGIDVAAQLATACGPP